MVRARFHCQSQPARHQYSTIASGLLTVRQCCDLPRFFENSLVAVRSCTVVWVSAEPGKRGCRVSKVRFVVQVNRLIVRQKGQDGLSTKATTIPTSFRRLGSARLSRSRAAHSEWPLRRAKCNAESPLIVGMFTSILAISIGMMVSRCLRRSASNEQRQHKRLALGYHGQEPEEHILINNE